MFEGLLLETGYSKPLTAITVGDKEAVLSAIADFHCLLKVKAATDQFAEGLECTGVLQYVKSHYDLMRPLLCYSTSHLTAGACVCM